jgi:hypothetical protein
MPPNQYANQEPPAGQAPGSQPNYEFFLNPAPAPKQPLINLGSTSLTKRIIIVVGGLVGFIIIIAILSSLLGSHTNYMPIITVAQDQNELVRVSTEGSTTSTTQTTQNLALNVELSLTTTQLQLLAYLKANGQVVSTTELDATRDASTDQALAAATAVSNYDAVFSKIMQTGLQNYINDLKTAYPTVGVKGKALIKQEAVGAKLLLDQANATANSLSS